MYCAKCGNLLKKEDNFCSICGTPRDTESKRNNKGSSSYGFASDDNPIELNDFFRFDEEKEKTLAAMDREIDDIKARATQNLMRHSSGNAGARRAARLAKKASESKNNSYRPARERSINEINADLDFNDEIFKISERTPLAGKRSQKTSTKARKEEKVPYEEKLSVNIPDVDILDIDTHEVENYHADNEKPSKIHSEPERTVHMPSRPSDLRQTAKRKHLFRENTIEVPNIFDEIAKSMERAKQQDVKEMEHTEKEGIVTALPDMDMEEGVFPISKESGQARKDDDIEEGVFPISHKPSAAAQDDGIEEGVFPINYTPKSDEPEAEPQKEKQSGNGHNEILDLPDDDEETESVYNLRKPSGLQSEDYFQDNRSSDYEYFRYTRSKKKKGPNVFVIASAILIIIFASLGIKMLLSGDSPLIVFQQIKDVFATSQESQEPLDIISDEQEQQESGDGTQDETGQAMTSDLKTQGATDPRKMLQYVLSTGVNKNIAEVIYNADLKFIPEKTYKTEDINTSEPITENLFYEEGGKKYYYTEIIMTTMVQFNSLWVDYVNDNDKAVLDVIKKGSKAYEKTMSFNFNGTKETFVEFEIGEIRKSKDGFYVWTKEKINVIKDNATSTINYDWIYYLEVTDNRNIKIINYVKE